MLETNPLQWSVSDVVDFITSTDCASLAKIFQEQVQYTNLSFAYFLSSYQEKVYIKKYYKSQSNIYANPYTFFLLKDIDGQALLLLTLPTVQECMDLKLGPAIKLCHQIERVKVAFYSQFAN